MDDETKTFITLKHGVKITPVDGSTFYASFNYEEDLVEFLAANGFKGSMVIYRSSHAPGTINVLSNNLDEILRALDDYDKHRQ